MRGDVGRWTTRRGRRDLTRSRRRGGTTFDPLTSISWQTAWWAGDPAWTKPSDGAAVASWTSGVGGRTLAQATGANQPLYRASASGLNNQPCIEFDGVNDSLFDETFVGPTSDPYTVIWIGRYTNASPGALQYMVTAWNSVFGAPCQYISRAISGVYGARWTTSRNGTLSSTDLTPHFARSQIGTTDTARIDEVGIGILADPGAAAATSALTVGAWATSATTAGAPHLFGQVAFVGFFPGDISTAPQWTAFKVWAATTYGITIA